MIKLVVWVASVMLIGMTIGQLTNSEIIGWYKTLNQSPLSPPNYVFGIAWSILYFLIGVSGWQIWQQKDNIPCVKQLFVMQLILNWLWSPIFFTYHLTGIALICLLLIHALTAVLMIKAYEKLRIVTWLLTPYICWLTFAAYLNFYVWWNN